MWVMISGVECFNIPVCKFQSLYKVIFEDCVQTCVCLGRFHCSCERDDGDWFRGAGDCAATNRTQSWTVSSAPPPAPKYSSWLSHEHPQLRGFHLFSVLLKEGYPWSCSWWMLCYSPHFNKWERTSTHSMKRFFVQCINQVLGQSLWFSKRISSLILSLCLSSKSGPFYAD